MIELLPNFLVDAGIVTAFITVFGVITSASINAMVSKRNSANALSNDKIKEILDRLELTTTETNVKVNNLGQDVNEVRDGTIKASRYRLFHDMTLYIKKGSVSLEEFREITILFESYRKMGGNGEIEALYRIFSELKIQGVTK